jgi:hypothetical protein
MSANRTKRPSESPPQLPPIECFSSVEHPFIIYPPAATMGEHAGDNQDQLSRELSDQETLGLASPWPLRNSLRAVSEPAFPQPGPASREQKTEDGANKGNLSRPRKTSTSGPGEDERGFVTGFRLVCLMVGLMCAQFLVSIDRTIISTVRRDVDNCPF